MGKGGDRGARQSIKAITPTFFLPHQGEGKRAGTGWILLKSRKGAVPDIFEEAPEGFGRKWGTAYRAPTTLEPNGARRDFMWAASQTAEIRADFMPTSPSYF